jgi:hypothetical protein
MSQQCRLSVRVCPCRELRGDFVLLTRRCIYTVIFGLGTAWEYRLALIVVMAMIIRGFWDIEGKISRSGLLFPALQHSYSLGVTLSNEEICYLTLTHTIFSKLQWLMRFMWKESGQLRLCVTSRLPESVEGNCNRPTVADVSMHITLYMHNVICTRRRTPSRSFMKVLAH